MTETGSRLLQRPLGLPHTSSIAGGTGVLLMARFGISLGYFVAAVSLAHLLRTAERGAVAFVTVTALVVSAASRIGFDDATNVFAARDERLRPALLGNVLAVAALASTAVGAAVAGTLLALPTLRPGDVRPRDLLLLLFGGILSAVSTSGGNYLIGCSRFASWAVASVAASWGYAALLLAGSAFVTIDVTRAVIAWTGSQALGVLVGWVAALRVAGIGRPQLGLLRTTTPFAFRAWVGSFSSFLNARVDQTIMGVISTERSLGLYAVAVNAGEIALYLPEAVGMVLVPVIATTAPEERSAQTMRIARVLLVLTSVGAAIAAFGGWLLLPLVFGHDYAGSVGPFLWLLPGAIGFSFLRTFSSSLLASGTPMRYSLGSAVALVTGVVLDLLLIPGHGATGAAIAASLAFLAGGLTAIVAHRHAAGWAWRELLPQREDLALITALARRVGGRS
jgi:O-antigen/teichoic acid export membrane protein